MPKKAEWRDWDKVEVALRIAMEQNHGLIPGRQWFAETANLPLFYALGNYHGGLDEIRRKIGVYGIKYCPGCDTVYPKENFRIRTKKTKSGESDTFRDHVCKKCSSKESADYRATKKGKVAELYRRAKVRAVKNNRQFDLTKEWIEARLEANDWRCEVTRISFEPGSEHGYHSLYAMSLDRIDSKGGYTRDNVRIVINWLNVAKMDLSDKDFRDLCKRVVDSN